jgi:prophage regulatory protein
MPHQTSIAGPLPGAVRLLRLPEVLRCIGLGRSTFYARKKQGLFTEPVHIGPGTAAWPSNEVEEILRAHVAAAGPAELRALVSRLHASRVRHLPKLRRVELLV